MLPEIEQLLILQDSDRKIRLLRVEHKNSPLERKSLEERLAHAQKELEAARLKAKEVEVERKKLENEAQSIRDRVNKYQAQKLQTRKNDEFQALNNEIERGEKDIRAIEDRELDFMDAADKQKALIAAKEKDFTAIKSQVEKQTADIDVKIAAIATQLTEIEADRAKLAEVVEEDLRDTYDRLIKMKNGEAVVGLRHDVCSGCHMKVTPTTSSLCRSGREIVHCENCGRILYWED
jgi:predicted  nucleic acid-binding Zn-ribbon protein